MHGYKKIICSSRQGIYLHIQYENLDEINKSHRQVPRNIRSFFISSGQNQQTKIPKKIRMLFWIFYLPIFFFLFLLHKKCQVSKVVNVHWMVQRSPRFWAPFGCPGRWSQGLGAIVQGFYVAVKSTLEMPFHTGTVLVLCFFFILLQSKYRI